MGKFNVEVHDGKAVMTRKGKGLTVVNEPVEAPPSESAEQAPPTGDQPSEQPADSPSEQPADPTEAPKPRNRPGRSE